VAENISVEGAMARGGAGWLVVVIAIGGAMVGGRIMADEPAGPRAEAWRRVQQALDERRPQSAGAALVGIEAEAVAAGAWDEAARAIATRVVVETGDRPPDDPERAVRLARRIAEAPEATRQVLEAIEANWLVGYFLANRWRYQQRTAGGADGGLETIAEWDLPRFVAEIRSRFAAALGPPGSPERRRLQGQAVERWALLLPPAAMPDAWRPTLFDVVAHDALSFFALGERALVEPEDVFEIDAAGPALAGADAYRAWRPEETTTDTGSPLLAAALLHRELLDFHAGNATRTAFLAADLERIEWAARSAVGDDVAARHRQALEAFIAAAGDDPTGALGRHRLATLLEADDPAAALALVRDGMARHPDSPGGRLCRQLAAALEVPQLQLLAERSWAEPWPALRVRYRNLTRLHFRLCRVDWQARLAAGRAHTSWIDDADRAAILALPAERQRVVELPATADGRPREEDVAVDGLAAGLAPGAWWLVASPRPGAPGDDNPVSATLVWVTRLALVTESSRPVFTGRDGPAPVLPAVGHVVDLATGEPVAGAEVTPWRRDRRQGFRAAAAVTTDASGRFQLPAAPGDELVVAAAATIAGVRHEIVAEPLQVWPAALDRDVATIVLVTDRGIHRPGQTVFFKGIACRGDREQGDYAALADRPVTVVLRDANGREVATVETTTRATGSFDGSFALPSGGLPGQWSITATAGAAQGAVAVRVEEYRRPKFRVELAAPEGRVALGEEVVLSGTATTYTGLPVAGAKVAWRVERLVRWPEWCRWFFPGLPVGGAARRIARGSAVTDETGRFTVRFPARADRALPRDALPVFRFRTAAAVTDAGGETHVAERTIAAGYTDVEATLSADGVEVAGGAASAEVTIEVATRALDGTPRPAAGTLTVARLVQPAAVPRGLLVPRPGRGGVPAPDPADPAGWPDGEELFTAAVATDAAGSASIRVPLPPGIYRATVTLQGAGDAPSAKAVQVVEVIDPAAAAYGVKVALALHPAVREAAPGDTFRALLGTGHTTGRALVEISQAGRTLSREWTEPGRTQWPLALAVTAAQRGGFTVRAWLVRDGRLTTVARTIDVPWTDRKLAVEWERFRRVVEPGSGEKWRLRIRGGGDDAGGRGGPALAELLAILSDQSLDALSPHAWPEAGLFGLFRRESGTVTDQFTNGAVALVGIDGQFVVADVEVPALEWREFRFPFGRPRFLGGGRGRDLRGAVPGAAVMMADGPPRPGMALAKGQAAGAPAAEAAEVAFADEAPPGDVPEGRSVAAPAPPPRRRLVETAFFLPALTTAPDGTLAIEFTLPDTLTTWSFKGLAHDARLRSGTLVDTAVASKDLMVEPLVPRFVREGDVVEIPVKVGNRSSGRLTGTIRLALADARSGADRGGLVDGPRELPFDVAAGATLVVPFLLRVAPGTDLLEYTATGVAPRGSDGEQGLLPVLPARVPVTDTVPVTLRGPARRTVTLERLAAGGADSEALVVQAASNPAWYAVLALPVLVEEPDESTEGLFARLFANALAARLATADPRIATVFEQWRQGGALDSPLDRDAQLVRTLLEETPWVRDAADERAARARIGLLLDPNRTAAETAAALARLEALRNPDGGWPWFPGGATSDPVTVAIIAGFGRLRAAGVPIDVQPALAALPWLDGRLVAERRAAERLGAGATITPLGAAALYARSFFTPDVPAAGDAATALGWGLDTAARTWMKLDARLPQVQAALALFRAGRREPARGIVDSLRQRAVDAAVPRGAEGEAWQGMWWRDAHPGWWGWEHAPIATQALSIEAFNEIAGDAAAVEAMKVWLLCQKRTNRWGAQPATAAAVGTLLGRGADLLGAAPPVTVTIGGREVDGSAGSAGTGFVETRLVGAAVTPEAATITFSAPGAGLAFGAVHWLHRTAIDDVAAAGRAELAIDKRLFVKRSTKAGPVLEPLAAETLVAPGDELVVRLVVTSDRDYGFLELADHRPALVEPIDVLSGWRSGDGVVWYQAVRDASTRLFFEHLPRGTHVFEYALRVARRGRASAGFATIASRYAPEFSARSAAARLEVR
jgi:hypothetical protein